MKVVLDSSAVLAVVWREPGAEIVTEMIPDAKISAVNMAEVYSKLADHGAAGEAARDLVLDMKLEVVAYDDMQAQRTGKLRQPTRSFGLSIGDRACLGLAEAKNATAVTAEKSWATLGLGIDVKTIR
jgi:PIN domain nuclease of toxin-antitoxin system